jgi:serine/threonine-protein kinase
MGDRESEQLFAREARIVADLQHPRIVSVTDFGKLDSTHVMVLEYVHGYHLGHWLRFVSATRGRIPVPQATHIVQRVLEALIFAHSRARPDGSPLGIVHRDVSPANVLIDVQGNIKLSDFGIARTADDEFLTQRGCFRGTLSYGAPEALQGAAPTPKMDQYAAAVVFYQTLAGSNPFKGDGQSETLNRVLNHVPPPLATIRDDVPPAIDAALARALAKDPEQRFPSVADFARAVRDACTWSKAEAAESFAQQIATDFGGAELATRLGLEPLSVLDAAWREHGIESAAPLGSIGPSSTTVRYGSGAKSVEQPSGKPSRRAASRTPTALRHPALWLLIAAITAGAGAAAVITLLAPPAPPAARVLVIEKEQGASAPEPVTPNPLPSASPDPIDTAAVATAAAAKPRAPAPRAAPSNRGALLARAFQLKEANVQSCFQQYAAESAAQPQMAVAFQIDASGAVQHASVSPAELANAPLGRCIIAVARTTNFGPQSEGISFTIPIATRVVRR